MMTRIPILVVEDNEAMQQLFRIQLGPRFEVFSAYDMETALEILNKEEFTSIIKAIALDANFPEKEGGSMSPRNVYRVLKTILEKELSCPVIAIPQDRDTSKILVKRGCTHTCPKESLPLMLKELFPDRRHAPAAHP